MSDFLKSCVARYQELAGPKGANLRKAITPYVDEAMDYDVHATPAGGQPPPSGELGAIASKVLMKVLYAARIARFDLLWLVGFLARRVTKWDTYCDRALHKLMFYINSTLDVCM